MTNEMYIFECEPECSKCHKNTKLEDITFVPIKTPMGSDGIVKLCRECYLQAAQIILEWVNK